MLSMLNVGCEERAAGARGARAPVPRVGESVRRERRLSLSVCMGGARGEGEGVGVRVEGVWCSSRRMCMCRSRCGWCSGGGGGGGSERRRRTLTRRRGKNAQPASPSSAQRRLSPLRTVQRHHSVEQLVPRLTTAAWRPIFARSSGCGYGALCGRDIRRSTKERLELKPEVRHSEMALLADPVLQARRAAVVHVARAWGGGGRGRRVSGAW